MVEGSNNREMDCAGKPGSASWEVDQGFLLLEPGQKRCYRGSSGCLDDEIHPTPNETVMASC